MEARALASLGARDECQRVLDEAQNLFELRNSLEDPAWISYFDGAELAAEVAHCYLGLGEFEDAAALLEQSAQDSEYARSNAFAGIIQVESLIAAGQHEQAAKIGMTVLASCREIASARIDVYLANLQQRLDSHPHSATVTALAEELKHVRHLRSQR